MLSLIFLIAALVLFIVAACGIPAGRVHLPSAGLACYIASLLAPKL